jgi:putative SOS response-associated peptidase YedK
MPGRLPGGCKTGQSIARRAWGTANMGKIHLDESRPLAFFAGVWTRWTSVRKIKEGETTNDLFAFLTTQPNAIVAPIHPKAMPVILTKPEQIEEWMSAPIADALALQLPLPDDALRRRRHVDEKRGK